MLFLKQISELETCDIREFHVIFGMVLGRFMNIVDRSHTSKLILRYVMVPDTSQYLPTYHTHWRYSQVQKMLDFGSLKKHAYQIFLGFLQSKIQALEYFF